MLIRWALRDIRNHLGFTLFFAFNLALGLVGFVTLDTLQSSLAQAFQQVSKNALSADLSVSSRRPLTSDEQLIIKSTLRSDYQEVEKRGLYSMLAAAGQSKLVNLQAVGDLYPFYGALTLRESGIVRGVTPKPISDQRILWIRKELAEQMKLQIGDEVKIGASKFKIGDVIEKDPADTLSGVSVAPRVYLGLNFLEETQLIRKGSRVDYDYFFKVSPSADVENLERKLNRQLTDPRIKVTSHKSDGEGFSRALAYFNDYLSLVALTALFLAGIGVTYLFRNYLHRRIKELAILKTIGLTQKRIGQLYLLKLALFGVLGSLMTFLLTIILLPILGHVIKPFNPADTAPMLTWSSVVLTFFVSTLASIGICLPSLLQAIQVKPLHLLQSSQLPQKSSRSRTILAWTPVMLAYWMLAMVQANSWRLGTLFVASFFVAIAMLALTSRLLPTLFRSVNFTNFTNFTYRLATHQIMRAKTVTTTIFVVIALGVLLMNLIPQLYSNIVEDFNTGGGYERPSLFLADIQPDQLAELQALVKELGTQLTSPSPMIMARLTEVNGQPFKKLEKEGQLGSREDDRRRGFTNRTFNLSYSDRVEPWEKIIKGRPFSKRVNQATSSQDLAEISMEQRFAKRLKFKINDRLTFDIQGTQINGKIVNLRSVRWTSFQPNFFVQLQPGFLEDAPKIYLATIPALPEEKKTAVQTRVTERFTNISIIDLTATVKSILTMVERMSQALNLMAYMVLLAGLVVLFTIVHHQSQRYTFSVGLLKTLGASWRQIRSVLRLEFLLVTLAASIIGMLLALGFSYLFATLVFDSGWQPNWLFAFIITTATILFSVVIIDIACRKATRIPPTLLLNSEL